MKSIKIELLRNSLRQMKDESVILDNTDKRFS